jgi:putative transcriptional regulator
MLQYVIYILQKEVNIIDNRIKLARVAKNLSQEELAIKVGVTRQTIGLIESGKYNPTLKLCISIANALDKTLNDLFWMEV